MSAIYKCLYCSQDTEHSDTGECLVCKERSYRQDRQAFLDERKGKIMEERIALIESDIFDLIIRSHHHAQ